MVQSCFSFSFRLIAVAVIIIFINGAFGSRKRRRRHRPAKLIIDTDFGGPIDDTWAIAYALKEQEIFNTFDIRLINTVGRNATARTTILANFLQRSQYKYNIDVGIGIDGPCGDPFLQIACVGWTWPYIEDNFTLNDYTSGTVYYNGNQRIIDIIENEATLSDPIYIISLGAMTNIDYIFNPLYLNRADLKQYVRMFSMSGSLYKNSLPFGYFVEFNIRDDIDAAQYIYNYANNFYKNLCVSTWDTGVLFQINENDYSSLIESINNDNNLLVKEMINMYEIWYINGGYLWNEGNPYLNESVKMFDLEMVIMAALVANMDIDEQYKSCINIMDYVNVESKYVIVNNTGFVIDGERINADLANFTQVDFAVNFTFPDGLESISQYATSVLIAQDTSSSSDESSDESGEESSEDDSSDGNGNKRKGGTKNGKKNKSKNKSQDTDD